jgi:hypothetical protein
MGAQAFRILALEAAGPNAPEVLDLVEGEDNHVGLLLRPAFQPPFIPLADPFHTFDFRQSPGDPIKVK